MFYKVVFWVLFLGVCTLVNHIMAFFAYRFCRKKKSRKECRNYACKYAEMCEFNTVFGCADKGSRG